jgi:putative FmdB family regulatory protein
MPLYEYQCATCDAQFEVLRSMSQANSPLACPRCAHTDVRKMISRFAAVSKDSGGSHMVSGSSGGSAGCGGCSGGHCSGCGH